ncbi:HAD family hydrolase [Nocardioides sp. NPDC047086]|uniref:HAD family hydrolase n=1 Tax=Nocardioides sp. NPDC047086 TaxID=3154810 RepID=UPI0033C9D909
MCAVLANSNGGDAHLKLDLTGPASKPDPRAYLLTCERAGIAPTEVLMVGNSLAHDVLGPLDAGLDAVLLDRHDAHPDAHVRRIDSLHDLSW